VLTLIVAAMTTVHATSEPRLTDGLRGIARMACAPVAERCNRRGRADYHSR